ncbi:hypothetical protein GT204_01035 [Streptomyces sp. SID4919]|uniref:hypothetical protein n=1 Tax=unclassified Streptomyces TaxID=2593676 RepID=UPI0008238470|nr:MULTISPECIES: hypothetical protein [unclassified Streptomyces]MYY07512.1 hypothetical protein [Streptomyces sp. SID4919]SCK62829.1 hypothetical protein YW7DRAFT_06841 [Streptomyces sp. AmelKG-E11A]
MPVRPYARTSSPVSTPRAGIRLPWWALLLPAAAFVILLGLLLNPAEAQAATAGPGAAQLLERVRDLLAR